MIHESLSSCIGNPAASQELNPIIDEIKRMNGLKDATKVKTFWKETVQLHEQLETESERNAEDADVVARLEDAKKRKAAAEARLHEVKARNEHLLKKVTIDVEKYKEEIEQESLPPTKQFAQTVMKAVFVILMLQKAAKDKATFMRLRLRCNRSANTGTRR
ncbi:hypothetical protein AAVH_05011 [Aphelenchoides avenae]|nr:hypothetical protein AAVH_05011 [Aphelenchus avenae]